MSLQIHHILCRAGFMDNYSYLLIDEASKKSAIIDPSETAPIIKKCQEIGIKPDYVFNTHHHFDHTDSNLDMKEIFGSKVVAAKKDAHRIPGFDIGVEEGNVFALGESVAEIIDVSAHTQGHILWYFKADKALFTGDTLFNFCVGGLFEGTEEEMVIALTKIKNLPDDVMFYPGHEYTLQCLPEAQNLDKHNPAMQKYMAIIEERMSKGLPISPIPLGLEKNCNPYLKNL